jgi:NMD protein affecting ribosome stability and mRNA decay
MAFTIACAHCGKATVQKTAKMRIYCTSACRAASWRNPETSARPCMYCGVPAGTVDHIPPKSIRDFLLSQGLYDRYPNVEVDACHECNCLLGARPLWTIVVRKRFIKQALRRRYKRILSMPDWTDAELGRMSPTMQATIQARIDIREWVNRRIDY